MLKYNSELALQNTKVKEDFVKVMSIAVGSTVEGVVTGITNFGAFVDLEGGETGLIHISEVADTYVKDVHNHLKMNERVRAKVISIDNEGKIGLSIKQLNEFQAKKVPSLSFEDRLSKFFKESSDRQKDIKKNPAEKKDSRQK